MRVLVTGGAGYIGSHAARALREAGHAPIVLDDLSRGHREAVSGDLIEDNLSDPRRIEDILRRERVEAVMHFAAYAFVGESGEKPLDYYENNVAGTVNLIRAMVAAGVNRIVFSSSCAIYGTPPSVPITEDMPANPISPYGRTKWMCEQILADSCRAYNLGAVCLRYFNVAGAASDGSLGEEHDPETHLIPLAIFAAIGRRKDIKIFGSDYPTPDGTCVRDYIHVEDLAAAHVAALPRVRVGEKVGLNLGIGKGFSVREVISSVEEVTGQSITAVPSDRREGDPAQLYADPRLGQSELGWQPEITELAPMVQSAYNWYQNQPRKGAA